MKKCILCILFFAISTAYIGCSSLEKPSMVFDKIVKAPSAYIETLKHPTEFPTEYLPEVLDIEDILAKNPLKDDENVKISLISETKFASTHFVQVRKKAEIKPHFHKKHDKTISIKKGNGIAILNGIRYFVKPGTVLQVPSKTRYKFINTGDELFVSLAVYTPPFDGKDMNYIEEEYVDKPRSEAQKEKEKREKNELITKRKKAEAGYVQEKGQSLNPNNVTRVTPQNSNQISATDNSDVFNNNYNQTYSYDGDSGYNIDSNAYSSIGEEYVTDEIDELFNESSQVNTKQENTIKPQYETGNPDNDFMFEDENDMIDNFNQSKPPGAFEFPYKNSFDGNNETSANEDFDFEKEIEKLNQLRDNNIISEDEYQYKMSKILDN